jgi:hypothetical protein
MADIGSLPANASVVPVYYNNWQKTISTDVGRDYKERLKAASLLWVSMNIR